MNKNSRIFIAGHNGLVGSAVYRNLLEKGYKNLVIVSKKKLEYGLYFFHNFYLPKLSKMSFSY